MTLVCLLCIHIVCRDERSVTTPSLCSGSPRDRSFALRSLILPANRRSLAAPNTGSEGMIELQ